MKSKWTIHIFITIPFSEIAYCTYEQAKVVQCSCREQWLTLH